MAAFLSVQMAALVHTMIENNKVVVAEFEVGEETLRDCEQQSRIFMSQKMKVGVFAVRIAESSFADPVVAYANAKAKEMAKC
jgi:hypothetical protein